jgi:glycosyltransferase involved in cell wall biosynthesis
LKLIILKDIPVPPNAPKEALAFTDTAIKQQLKGIGILHQLFHYEEAYLYAYRMEVIVRPLLWAVFLRLVSRGQCFFADETGRQQTISLSFLFSLLVGWLRDQWRMRSFLDAIRGELRSLQTQTQTNRPHKVIDVSKRPLYLRTDMGFGVKSGGSVGHIAGVLNNLAQFGADPVFITTDSIPTVSDEIETHVVPFSPHTWNIPWMLSLVTNKQIEEFTRQHFDPPTTSFIYQRYSINNYTGTKLALDLGLAFVLEYNGSEVWQRQNWGGGSIRQEDLSREIEILNFHAADLIVVVSEPLQEELVALGILAEKILINPNGVDPNTYSPTVDGSSVREKYGLADKVVIGFIGTFGAWHGAEVLADAYGKLLNEFPDYQDKVRLLLIGNGLKMPEVKDNLNRYGMMDYAILTGIVPQTEGAIHLAACDVLVASHVPTPDGSKFFGSPTKLFEYMAMGKGIVASKLDQIDDILEHKRTAWMVSPGDADDLMRGIKHMVDHPELRMELGKNARLEAVENYTWYGHTRKIIDRLKELLG